MKILVFNGSPRPHGNTVCMIESFMQKAIELGHEVVRYDLDKMNIKPCKACDACAEKGKCVLKDDWQKVAEAIEEADGIVFAAPLYWYTIPAQMKTLFDRMYSFQSKGFDIGKKKVGIIGACADETDESFKGFVFAIEKSVELLHWEVVGKVLANSVSAAGDVMNTKKIKKAAKLAKKF